MSKSEAGKTVLSIPIFHLGFYYRTQYHIPFTDRRKKSDSYNVKKTSGTVVNGDQVHLMQIFSNLVSNAVNTRRKVEKFSFW